MLGVSININNLCCNSAVLKKVGKIKPLMFFCAQFAQKKAKGSLGICMAWATSKMENNAFMTEITKADHQLSESFYFIKHMFSLG